MLESVSVIEVVLSGLVLALTLDNIGLRFKIKNVEEAVQLVGASLKNAVATEFETVHNRIDRLFDKGSTLQVQVEALTAEAKNEVTKLGSETLSVLNTGNSNGTNITAANTKVPSTNTTS